MHFDGVLVFAVNSNDLGLVEVAVLVLGVTRHADLELLRGPLHCRAFCVVFVVVFVVIHGLLWHITRARTRRWRFVPRVHRAGPCSRLRAVQYLRNFRWYHTPLFALLAHDPLNFLGTSPAFGGGRLLAFLLLLVQLGLQYLRLLLVRVHPVALRLVLLHGTAAQGAKVKSERR